MKWEKYHLMQWWTNVKTNIYKSIVVFNIITIIGSSIIYLLKG